MVDAIFTGGCQCGAVRYRLAAEPEATVCHCRMCQKAVGGPFAALSKVRNEAFAWTRGQPGAFRSSSAAERHFCRDCGTPLTFEYPHVEGLGVLVGAFDEPSRVAPEIQYGNESRVSWYGTLNALPGDRVTYADDPQMLHRISSSNHQHPDHDTEQWTPHPGGQPD